MPAKVSVKDVYMNVRLDPVTARLLSEMVDQDGRDKSEFIRAMIRALAAARISPARFAKLAAERNGEAV